MSEIASGARTRAIERLLAGGSMADPNESSESDEVLLALFNQDTIDGAIAAYDLLIERGDE